MKLTNFFTAETANIREIDEIDTQGRNLVVSADFGGILATLVPFLSRFQCFYKVFVNFIIFPVHFGSDFAGFSARPHL